MADVPDAYLGVWQRLLLRTPQAEDTTSEVYWLQTRDWHADIRVPADRPACSGKTSLAQLDHVELRGLSTQQGFAGVTEVVGDICRWHRKIDFQPSAGFDDVGRMQFETTNRVLEFGIEQDYFEIWQRLPDSLTNPWLDIRYADTGSADRTPSLIRIGIGKYFVHVRPRSNFLPGAGNYGMCGRGFHPRFCFSWPNAKTAVMGGEQAARTMAMVTEAAMKRKGGAVDEAKLDEVQR